MWYNGNMERQIIAFDIGDKRIGVAYSDPFNEYAMPGETYWRKGNFREDVKNIARIAEERFVGTIVCGLPVNFDGSESIQTEKTVRFIEALKKETKIPVVTEDERFTTLEARRVLIEGGVRREKRKNSVDSIAASYILESYLEKLKKQKKKKETKKMSLKEEYSDYEEEGNVVELTGEDGEKIKMEHLGTLEYHGEWYACFSPLDDENADEAEVVIYHLVGEEDEEVLEPVEDENLLDEVFAEFCNLYEDSEEWEDAAALDGDPEEE